MPCLLPPSFFVPFKTRYYFYYNYHHHHHHHRHYYYYYLQMNAQLENMKDNIKAEEDKKQQAAKSIGEIETTIAKREKDMQKRSHVYETKKAEYAQVIKRKRKKIKNKKKREREREDRTNFTFVHYS